MRRLGTVGAALVALLAAVVLSKTCARTPAIDSGRGESIASLEWIELGGYRQAILLRGADRRNPLLLFLHGGPGMPAMYLAHAFQRPLERDFTVVQWDRRGAGKSFREDLPPEAMKVSALLADAEELVLALRERFQQDDVYLVGHSFGSYLGTLLVLKRPDLFRAYVGVGQVVDEERARALQESFLRAEAARRGEDAAIRDLDERGRAVFETLLFRYGGELAGHTSWWPLLLTGLRAPEYNLADIARVAKGSSFSSAHMRYDVIDTSLGEHVRRYPVPTFFFTGRRDWTTPYPLIEEYYERIDAPYKELVWFDDSAHFPFFEEPERFADQMELVRLVVQGR